MIIRFVQGTPDDPISWDIEARENVAMPITPSHVEMLSRDGKTYTGAHIDGGIQARPIGYDKATTKAELLVDLGPENDDAAFSYMESKIGSPYDWTAIVDYLLPINWHRKNHLICSAFATLTLRKKLTLRWPIAVPAHMVNPRDLLLGLSCLMEIKGI